MPVNIPAGTKFEAIKPTTNVNRRSALVNSNDPTFTIEDFAQTVSAGLTFPITLNYIPMADALGGLVDSNLYQNDFGYGTGLFGDFIGGIGLSSSGTNLISAIIDSISGYSSIYIGDVFGALGPSFGISIQSVPIGSSLNLNTKGVNVFSCFVDSGAYDFGGIYTRFGIVNGDTPSPSLFVSNDLVTNIGGIEYIKVIYNGTPYKIQLIP
jgi:hypothetical protein